MALTKVSYSMIDMMPISVLDFGAVGDGTTINTSAIQAAFDFGVASGKSFNLHFPPGIYKSGQILLGSNSVAKGNIRIAITGAPKATRLLSTETSSNTFFLVPQLWGYGAGSDWLFRDLEFVSATPGQGIGLLFNALNWNTRIEDCIFDSFLTNLQIRSGITPTIQNCRFSNAASHGLYFQTASTGNPALDQPTSNARILNSYVNDNEYGLEMSGQQHVVRDCVFENNGTWAMYGLGDMSLVDGNWFESPNDVIYGGYSGTTFSNNIGIASAPLQPLFTGPGSADSFSPATANKSVLINTGEGQNRYPNFLFTAVMNNIQAVSQFRGINVDYTSPANSYSEQIIDADGNYYTGVYTLNQPQSSVSVLKISETVSGVLYEYDHVIVVFRSNPSVNVSPRYIIPEQSEWSVAALTPSVLDNSVSSTKFYVSRNAGTGRLEFGWSNKNAGTTKISFAIRPLADSAVQLSY